MRALVVFTDQSPHWAAGLLHRDFKHVWVLVEDERAGHWIEIDLRSTGLIVRSFCSTEDYDAVAELRNQGYRVLRCEADPELRVRTPMMWTHCVSLTKAVLGISNPLIITPFQLFKRLASKPVPSSWYVDMSLPGMGGGGSTRPAPRVATKSVLTQEEQRVMMDYEREGGLPTSEGARLQRKARGPAPLPPNPDWAKPHAGIKKNTGGGNSFYQ